MAFRELFTSPKPLIACIHLMPLPGSPHYAGIYGPLLQTFESSALPVVGLMFAR